MPGPWDSTTGNRAASSTATGRRSSGGPAPPCRRAWWRHWQGRRQRREPPGQDGRARMEIRTNDPPAPIPPHPLPAGLVDFVDIVGHLQRQGPGPGIRVGDGSRTWPAVRTPSSPSATPTTGWNGSQSRCTATKCGPSSTSGPFHTPGSSPGSTATTSGGRGTAGRTHGGSPPTRGRGGLMGDGQAPGWHRPVEKGVAHSVIALMCSEQYPIDHQRLNHLGHDVRQVLAGRPRRCGHADDPGNWSAMAMLRPRHPPLVPRQATRCRSPGQGHHPDLRAAPGRTLWSRNGVATALPCHPPCPPPPCRVSP